MLATTTAIGSVGPVCGVLSPPPPPVLSWRQPANVAAAARRGTTSCRGCKVLIRVKAPGGGVGSDQLLNAETQREIRRGGIEEWKAATHASDLVSFSADQPLRLCVSAFNPLIRL